MVVARVQRRTGTSGSTAGGLVAEQSAWHLVAEETWDVSVDILCEDGADVFRGVSFIFFIRAQLTIFAIELFFESDTSIAAIAEGKIDAEIERIFRQHNYVSFL